MKTQTAEEFLKDCAYYVDPNILNEFATTQIEALRERLREKATTFLDIKGNPCFKDKLTIDQTINEFLKEINDGK